MHVPATIPYNPSIRPDDAATVIARSVFGRRAPHFDPTFMSPKVVTFAGSVEGTASYIPQWMSGNRLTNSLMFEDANGGIAVGGFAASADPNGATLFVVNRINVVRAASAGVLDLGRVNGSLASPTVFLSGESGGTLQFNAWDGSALSRGAFISMVATEDWDGSGRGSQLIFRTTPNNSTTQTQALTIDQDQTLTSVGRITAPSFKLTGGPISASYSFAGSQHHIIAGDDGVTQNHVWMLAGTEVWRIDVNGTLRPGTNNARDLGASSQGVRDLFMANATANGAGAVTITSLRPGAAATATIAGWLKVMVGGTASYIPYWR